MPWALEVPAAAPLAQLCSLSASLGADTLAPVALQGTACIALGFLAALQARAWATKAWRLCIAQLGICMQQADLHVLCESKSCAAEAISASQRSLVPASVTARVACFAELQRSKSTNIHTAKLHTISSSSKCDANDEQSQCIKCTNKSCTRTLATAWLAQLSTRLAVVEAASTFQTHRVLVAPSASVALTNLCTRAAEFTRHTTLCALGCVG